MSYTVKSNAKSTNKIFNEMKKEDFLIAAENPYRQLQLDVFRDVRVTNKERCRKIYRDLVGDEEKTVIQNPNQTIEEQTFKETLKEIYKKYTSKDLKKEGLKKLSDFYFKREKQKTPTLKHALENFSFVLFFLEQGWPLDAALGAIKHHDQNVLSPYYQFFSSTANSKHVMLKPKDPLNILNALEYDVNRKAAVITVRGNGIWVKRLEDGAFLEGRAEQIYGTFSTECILDPSTGFVFSHFTTDNFLLRKLVMESHVDFTTLAGKKLLQHSELQVELNKERRKLEKAIEAPEFDQNKDTAKKHLKELEDISDKFFLTEDFSEDAWNSFNQKTKEILEKHFRSKLILREESNQYLSQQERLSRTALFPDKYNKIHQDFITSVKNLLVNNIRNKNVFKSYEKETKKLSSAFFSQKQHRKFSYSDFQSLMRKLTMEFYNRLEPFTPSEKKQPVKQLFDDYLLKNMMFSFEQLQDEFIALLADPNLKDKDRTLIETMINETNVLFLDTDHKDVAKHKDFCKQYHQILRETYNKLSDPLVGFRTVMAVALNLLVSITVVGLAVQVAQRKFFLFGKPQPKNKQVRKALKDTKRSVKKEETQEELPPTIAPK